MSHNNEAPAVGEVPPKPMGCVYGPWLAVQADCWVAMINDGTDDLVGIASWESEHWGSPEYGLEVICLSEELLRVSAQNQSLRALVGELAKQLSEQVKSTNTLAFWGKTNADDVRRYLPHIANDMLRQSNDAIDEMERSAALIAKAKEAGL